MVFARFKSGWPQIFWWHLLAFGRAMNARVPQAACLQTTHSIPDFKQNPRAQSLRESVRRVSRANPGDGC
ncbi:hypothetical protein DB811_14355 [Xanthomonas perforans]|uniref:Uncharacterized protein n=2 Tax=Xanthomonas TaxID=338 RepID=A0AAQ1BVP1_XANPE|nr:hypothetical protein BJD11_05925 [Xanthomonas euvesicatoria]AYO94725.1 hypothetical protein Xcom_06505 [Xanthomonas axonopodis pv. commiphoreae]PWH22136.1 hypothetical protein CDO09_18030 [Xanthomonas perforans]CAJ25100.1 hypothetical protein XCV3369 [Xanthomonas euvesicatoria pv. vesicatoria str. 85-10]OQP43527.1 hypothetical protein IB62_000825 [Xanthomonas euvesicatoria]